MKIVMVNIFAHTKFKNNVQSKTNNLNNVEVSFAYRAAFVGAGELRSFMQHLKYSVIEFTLIFIDNIKT